MITMHDNRDYYNVMMIIIYVSMLAAVADLGKVPGMLKHPLLLRIYENTEEGI